MDRSAPPRLPEFVTTDLARSSPLCSLLPRRQPDHRLRTPRTTQPRSDVACPMHLFELVPDACRSFRFLAGEVMPVSQ